MSSIPDLPIYVFHEDPGHGWLQVYKLDIVALGLEDDISSCSYERKNCVYLEEDSDLSKFFSAYEKRFGVKPKIKKQYYDKYAHIRNFEPYRKDSL